MKKKTTTEYILNDTEIDIAIKCLRYCKHRIETDKNSGIFKALSKEDLIKFKALLNQLV